MREHWLLEKCKSKLQWDITSHQAEWPSEKNLQTINATEDGGEKGTLLCCWRGCELVQPLWRIVWRFLTKLKIELPYDEAILLQGMYPEKTMVWKGASPQRSLQHYLEQPGHGSNLNVHPEEGIKEMWYIYSMKYYSAIKENEMMPFAATWMDLETVILSEISQTEKGKYRMISLKCGI